MLKLRDIDEDNVQYYKEQMGVKDGEPKSGKIKTIEDELMILISNSTGAEKDFLDYLLVNLEKVLFTKLSKDLLKEIKIKINKLYLPDQLFHGFSNLDSEEEIYKFFFKSRTGIDPSNKGKYSSNKEDLNTPAQRNMFLSDLKDRGIIPLQPLVTTNEILNFKKEVKKYLNFLKKNKIKNIVIEALEGLFSYEKIRDIRHELINKLKIETCPYCLRNYSTNYIEKGENKTMADLDHYYPKSLYPYLALSLYNFIPSCLHCNRSLKKQKVLSYKYYPYSNIDNGIKFKYIFFSHDDQKIEIDSTYEQVKKDIKNLKLDLIYKTSHNSYVENMLENFNKNPDSRIEDFTNITGLSDPLLKEVVGKAYKFKIENNEPLGKLTEDILKQYDIKL